VIEVLIIGFNFVAGLDSLGYFIEHGSQLHGYFALLQFLLCGAGIGIKIERRRPPTSQGAVAGASIAAAFSAEDA
jgi:hypothetical protein